ncbi:cellulose biosynthesis cyclic di-GMP-binding regulatory protein BcsB [Pseudomonas sp. SDT2931_S440]|uniref:cellulose biosynthesis cyclic di-GMP-binding regulatory protein BcsB n=1 Tax=unclassified Pseudomonas TaxID=196821 RepID=UPI0010686271|nr:MULTISPECIES: cellulose biosynthesis cyclic di-GMP-binding regulatory protein BcsB [unclassified Pseudomonas]NWB52989.1 cellulose biosynthesis cyclic di-GMP-binding regulatory protein BcsB [Pseudomonas sp. F8002]NWB67129.1 cellulose biosynthesis cyclic di-GMP-binding regulatory protein BcsB [Pseudomonas sp. I8001]NWB76026.1 cellulose biosynthesis cyclic di-GMP-binding regulatory protein BcsB [Pseudomonas sp. G5001]NWC68220.1 cellulose biosynthesis cyclic di-GMP-binding regulatory protein Bcs
MTSTLFARPQSRGVLALMIASLLGLGSQAQAAAPAVAVQSTDEGYSLTLKQLGRRDTMNLQGVEASDSVNFDIRADEVVKGAQLLLKYSYSPALLADLSQINVLVNDEVAASLPLPKEGAGIQQEKLVQIPAHLITEFNRLSLQFIGHYTMSCEDPLHSSLWAKISNSSELKVQVQPIVLKDDLSVLPLPFFDKRDARQVSLPFVFASAPDNAALEAAGALSSWVGGLASYRGATFPTTLGEIPAKGNAIVLVQSTQAVDVHGVAVPEPKGPTLTLITNPNDPNGKLLIVSGRDGAELKRAATAVVLGNPVLTGNSVVITRLDTLAPRSPYDAPNWLPSNRPVRLGELVELKKLNVSGYNPGPISVDLRLPPDLFNWREEGVPLNVKYRYTPQQVSTNSSLLIGLNDQFMKSVALPSVSNLGGGQSLLDQLKKDETLPREVTTLLPISSASPKSKLQLRFMYDYIKEGECRDIIVDNMRGAIDPDSSLDLSSYQHFIAMPNLGVFNDSGFPFTRLADLSESAVVMPDNVGTDELSAYLTVMGRFGESTGYPATAVKVVQAKDVQSVADKDLLVLATGGNQPLLQQWQQYLPATSDGLQHHFLLSDLPRYVRSWISPDAAANQHTANAGITFSGLSNSTWFAGFQSPLKAGRSVVLIASNQPQGLLEATSALIGGDDYKDSIQGSLAVVQGTQISSLVADQQYYVGDLNYFKFMQWQLSQNLGWMLAITFLGLLVLTCLIYLALRARAKRRLA